MKKASSNKHAWLEIALFVLFSYGLNYALLSWGQDSILPWAVRELIKKWGLLIQMWIPGISSIVLRILFKSGFKNIGLKFGNKIFWFLAFGIPFFTTLFSYLIVLLAGDLTLITSLSRIIYHDPLKLFGINWPEYFPNIPILMLLSRLIIILTIGMSVNYVLCFGEELGWRGYLQQRIIKTGFKYPYFLCGLIWAGWHMPFSGYFNTPDLLHGYQSAQFLINVILLGILIGKIQIFSESIWISTLFHTSHNLINFELLPAFFYMQLLFIVYRGKWGCYECFLWLHDPLVVSLPGSFIKIHLLE
ncbi:MAG: CPBP family intramembrane metalloprotease [Anaerolineae bacterium]|nr:CPBP family intramembrane metalloprotease [Anaerolineae bacterium]